ncbi:hypothetical protein ACHQM5_020172 [Ranunculus cassubicifolius]
MLEWDSKGKQGSMTLLLDFVTVHTPMDEEELTRPTLMATEIELPVAYLNR